MKKIKNLWTVWVSWALCLAVIGLVSGFSLRISQKAAADLAQGFLDQCYRSNRPQDYSDIARAYLHPDNTLFNMEMEIRNSLDKTYAENSIDHNLQMHLEDRSVTIQNHVFSWPKTHRIYALVKQKIDTQGNHAHTFEESYNVMVEVSEVDHHFYITDLYATNDGISTMLNKNRVDAINDDNSKKFSIRLPSGQTATAKNTPFLFNGSSKGIFPKSEPSYAEIEMNQRITAYKIYKNPRELWLAQIENLDNMLTYFNRVQ